MSLDDVKDEIGSLSATRISTYLTCPRKFWYKYKLGKKPDETEAMRRGSAIHDEAERYLKGDLAELSEPTLIEAESNGMFPDPGQVWYVETPLRETGITIAGIPVIGAADLMYEDDGQIVVRDWKTRSSFSYAPDAAELADDLQLHIYAYAAHHLFFGRESFVFEHVNLLKEDKGGPRSSRVRCEVPVSDILDRIEAVEYDVFDMLRTYEKDEVRDVEKDTSSCYKYGPCYYKTDHDCDETPHAPKYWNDN